MKMETEEMNDLSATALDHAQHPRNYGPLSSFNGHARVKGSCGDTMEFWVMGDEGKIKEVSFTTDGCGSSIACGSMVALLAVGASAKDAHKFDPEFVLESLGGIPPASEHCATLAVKTLTAACNDYLEQRREGGVAGQGTGERQSETPESSSNLNNPEHKG